MRDSVAVIVAFGSAIVGAVLHGTYENWRDWRARPRLQIDYKGVEGANKVEVDYRKPDHQHIAEIYVRARVQNAGKRPAKNCLVYLTALTEVHPSGTTTPTSFHDPMPLTWAGYDFSPRGIPRGVPFYVDLMRVSKHQSGWLISVEKLLGSQGNLTAYRGTYRFQLTATADNADPFVYEIDVSYNGDWNNLRAVAHTKG